MSIKTKEEPVKTKVKPKKWEINQDDYLELLESIPTMPHIIDYFL